MNTGVNEGGHAAVPSNQERREAAKNKLEQELKARADHDRRKKQLTIAAVVGGAVLVIGAAAVVFAVTRGDDTDTTATDDPLTEATEDPWEIPEPEALPAARAEALPPTVDCSYTEAAMPAAREAELPPASDVPTEGTVDVTLEMSGGPVTLTLDRAKSPCTVNSFVSLAEQGFYNDTECHRLTTGGIFVLQCGDPSATGSGGPGYAFADEFPRDQYADLSEEDMMFTQTIYPRGTVAMANAGANTNGSQFFLVYDDSPLAPAYNVFGTIDDEGLRVIDEVAAGGAPENDGPPNAPADISTVTVRG